MSRFLSRELLHTGPPGWAAAAAAALLCRRLLTPLARPLSQCPDAAAAAASAAASASSCDGVPSPSLTVSYLIHSCGLSPEAAISASKKVRIETTDNPDAVLELLRDSGFSTAQVATVVSKLPNLLRMRVAETLEPKLECLRGAGISGPRLPKLLCSNPYILSRSLERKIAPALELLQRVHSPGVPVSETLRLSLRLMPEHQLTNIQALRHRGVPDARISKLLRTRPLALVHLPARFEEMVAAVEAMGLDPANAMFPDALWVRSCMTKETWERKMAVYRSLGWSDSEISSAFVRQPFILALSEEGIRRKMEFFEGKLGVTHATLCRKPSLLLFSLEKRIAPRCAVLKVLLGGGVLRDGKMGLVYVLRMSEKLFLQRFVAKYMEEAPAVVDAHRGKVEFSGFGTLARFVETSIRRR